MHYLLVHGSWHGKWCWQKLIPRLEKAGHTVRCFDLPGSGDRFQEAENVTFDTMQNALCDEVMRANGPLALVAHSFAGFLAASVAEEFSEKILHTFYIAAWLPREGFSLVDMAVAYNNSDLPKIFIHSENPALKAIDPAGAKELFYHDCKEEDKEWAARQLLPKPKEPDDRKMKKTVPIKSIKNSTYLLCSIDRVVNPQSQKDMAEKFGFLPEQIISIHAGHSPFLSQPEALAKLLALHFH